MGEPTALVVAALIAAAATIFGVLFARHRDENIGIEHVDPQTLFAAQLVYTRHLEEQLAAKDATIERLTKELRYQRRGAGQRRLRPPDDGSTC